MIGEEHGVALQRTSNLARGTEDARDPSEREEIDPEDGRMDEEDGRVRDLFVHRQEVAGVDCPCYRTGVFERALRKYEFRYPKQRWTCTRSI